MFKNRKSIFLIIIVAVVSCIVTNIFNKVIFDASYGESMKKIMAVKAIIEEYGMYEADEDDVADYASMGITAAVKDPYTVYFLRKNFLHIPQIFRLHI